MRMGRWLWAFVPIAGFGLAAVAACVGDDAATAPPAAVVDAGGGTDTSVPIGEAGGPEAGVDSGTDSGLPKPTNCSGVAPPSLFAPKAGSGTFCKEDGGDHCLVGEHCCRDLSLNTQACAASCPSSAGETDIACANTAECPVGLVCCGQGVVRTDLCSYAVVEGFTASACQVSCSNNEFQLCFSGDCAGDAGKQCTPARPLTLDNTTVSNAQLGGCR